MWLVETFFGLFSTVPSLVALEAPTLGFFIQPKAHSASFSAFFPHVWFTMPFNAAIRLAGARILKLS